MKRLALISLLAALLCSCKAELWNVVSGYGWLCLDNTAINAIATKGSVDRDFIVSIADEGGNTIQSYSAGNVPSKVSLPAGNYTLVTYSSNIESWKSLNGGAGAAAYRDSAPFTIEPEMYAYVKVVAPMVNYGVRFLVDEGLDQWFTRFSLAVNGSQGRSLALAQGVTGWFDDEKVTVFLNATNTDGDSFKGTSYSLNTKKGHRYTFRYSLSPVEPQTGGSDITIIIDDEFIDGGEEIIVVE